MQMSFICEIQQKCLIFLTALIASSVSDSPSLLYSSNLNIYAEEFRSPEWAGTRHKRQVEVCFPPILCDSNPYVNIYRTADGTCNNLMNPYWGASNIPFIRRIPRDPPGDDFRCPLCPKPRNVSSTINAVLPPGQKDRITLMVMQWGQLTDHDMLFTPEDEDPACCEDFRTPQPTSPSCFPIDVIGDSFYGSFDPPLTCLPFEGTDRETINERTIYLDASTVYGSTEAEQIELRAFFGGRLKIGNQIESGYCSRRNDVCPRTFLPSRYGEDGNIKFFAGDHRVEHQPALTSLHTALVRLHNEVAHKLRCQDDETTFQDSEPMDHIIVDALINKLLALPPFDFGSDLHARNIKRGRDHGIPGYIFWFNRCAEKHQKPLIQTFHDLCSYMPISVVDTFKDLYENVEDIDLFPAGIAEFEVPGGLIGPTFACIIAEQFNHIKYGDRFWLYEKYYNFIEKLRSHKPLLCDIKNREYILLVFCFGFKIVRSIFLIYMSSSTKYEYDIWFIANHVLYFFSGGIGLNTIDLFFCIIRYILILMDSLEKKIILQKENTNSSSSKKLQNQQKKELCQNIEIEIFALKELTNEFYRLFGLVVCIFFLCDFVYIFSFVTKLTLETNYNFEEMIDKGSGFIYLFYIISISDLPQQKVS
ncbi:Peroxidasin [Armadillidium nasatum]|uniref:Peroxidasin n=1 Tax=Armadillidium nasatum TaxID=96803 RepID=A0A5N5SKD3_9CRUS|nr:Peroxidasin [Armadillidium nasatum]